jgi:predicted phosphodiesterase
MYLARIKLDVKSDEFLLEPFGDLHIGSRFVDYDKLHERIEAIKAEDNRFWIGMGDYIESIGPYRRGRVDKRWMEWLNKHGITTPIQQLDEFFKLVEPIKHKCLGLVFGNHDYTQLDLTDLQLLCVNHGYRFLGTMAMLELDLGPRRDVVWACHGSYNGMRTGGAINRLEDLSRKYLADVYLHAHTHLKQAVAGSRIIADFSVNPPKLTEKKIVYVLTGCFIKEHIEDDVNYAELKPTPKTTRVGTITLGFPLDRGETINVYD